MNHERNLTNRLQVSTLTLVAMVATARCPTLPDGRCTGLKSWEYVSNVDAMSVDNALYTVTLSYEHRANKFTNAIVVLLI